MINEANKNKNEAKSDNARKFIFEDFDENFLTNKEIEAYDLVVNWLAVSENIEERVVKRDFGNNTIKYLHVVKKTILGDRKTVKNNITEEEYENLASASIAELRKRRHVFVYNQDATEYEMKYDKFSNGALHMIEVDAATEKERNQFDMSCVLSEAKEVSDDSRYSGYGILEML